MPLPTLTKLIALAESGGTVIFSGALPKDVPGMTELAQRRAALQQLVAKLSFKAAGGEESLREGVIGKGRIRKGDLEAALRESQIARERCVDHPGLLLVRRKYEFGRHYFLANQGTTLCDGWVGLSVSARSVVVMDPLSGRTGVAEMRGAADGTVEVRLRIEPGHSLILRTLEHRAVEGPKWTCHRPSKAAAEIAGPWRVEFLQGGPVLPRPYEARQLTSWTENGDPETRRFAGTAVYRTKFTVSGQGPWILDLGAVRHSARVRVNGRQLGTLIMHPYCLELTDVKSGDNALEVEVTNLSANRIRDLDVRQVPWRIFRDANVVNIRYRPFDASPWPVMESGLIGPVTLRGAWH
jgi:hypothetical protein